MLEEFTKFKSMVERQIGRKLKTLRADGGKEYVSNDFTFLSGKEGIMHEVVPHYTLQKNGTSKRKSRTIMNIIISMLK